MTSRITPSPRPRALIVGAGLIGLASAWRLWQQGFEVTLVERDRPGAGASSAAAGMLSAVAETAPEDEAFARLCGESGRRWPDFARALEAASEMKVGLIGGPTLVVAESEDERAELRRLEAHLGRKDLLQWIEGDELRRLEPALSRGVRDGCVAPQDGQVDNRAAVAALVVALARCGARVQCGLAARRLWLKGDRVAGIVTDAGTIEADLVVVASGVGAEHLFAASGLDGVVPPVEPVKGQLLAIEMDPLRPAVRHVVRARAAYLVPRASGRLIIGATSEPGIHDLTLSEEQGDALHRAALALFPALGGLPVVEQWAGLRPKLPSGLPLIGTALEGLIVALGHYRNGVLLTPITADLVAGLATGRLAPGDEALCAPFAPRARQA